MSWFLFLAVTAALALLLSRMSAVPPSGGTLTRNDVAIVNKFNIAKAGLLRVDMFQNNPLNNSNINTPGFTNVDTPGQIPANSLFLTKAIRIDLLATTLLADNADLLFVLENFVVEFRVGASSDAVVSLFSEDVIITPLPPDTTAGAPLATSGGVRIGHEQPGWGLWWPFRGDAVPIDANVTYELSLIADATPAWIAAGVNLEGYGKLFGDAEGDLAQMLGAHAG